MKPVRYCPRSLVLAQIRGAGPVRVDQKAWPAELNVGGF
jgi:hypothetical protein